MYHLDANETYRENATQEYYVLFWTNPGSNTRQISSCTAIYLLSHEPSKLEELDVRNIAVEVRTKS